MSVATDNPFPPPGGKILEFSNFRLYSYRSTLFFFSRFDRLLLPWIPTFPLVGNGSRHCVGWALAPTLSKNVLGGHKGVFSLSFLLWLGICGRGFVFYWVG